MNGYKLWRVYVDGDDGMIYDERFIISQDEERAYELGCGADLSPYAEKAGFGWMIEAFEDSWHADELTGTNREALFDAVLGQPVDVPFFMRHLPEFESDGSPVPSDEELKKWPLYNSPAEGSPEEAEAE